MNYIDLAIVILLGVSTLLGLWRGVIREILSLVIWIMAFWLGIFHYHSLTKYITFVEAETVKNTVAGAIIFFAVLLLGAIVSWGVRSVLKKSDLGGLDRALGMLFGVARGFVIVLVFTWLGKFGSVTELELWQESKLVPPLNSSAEYIIDKLPEEWREVINR